MLERIYIRCHKTAHLETVHIKNFSFYRKNISSWISYYFSITTCPYTFQNCSAHFSASLYICKIYIVAEIGISILNVHLKTVFWRRIVTPYSTTVDVGNINNKGQNEQKMVYILWCVLCTVLKCLQAVNNKKESE